MGLFVCAPLAFPGCWLLQLQVWDPPDKTKTQGKDHCVTPQVQRSLAGLPSSLHLSESSYCVS